MTVDLFENLDFSNQDAPSEDFISSLRQKFPTEDEVDKVLTRKLRNRPTGEYRRISLEDMSERLHRFMTDMVYGDFSVRDIHWFTGGVSKIQIGFYLDWVDGQGIRREDRLVVRMDPKEGSNTTSRRRESDLISLVEGTVPVPRVFWLDEEGVYFPQPALIYEYVTGVTKLSGSSTGRVSGIGTRFDAKLRDELADRFMKSLAAIHRIPLTESRYGSLQVPEVGTDQAASWLLNQGRRIWEEDRGYDSPVMELAIQWLESNLPLTDRVSVVHGDFRTGNFLFDPETLNTTAWLDWERGHLGDRHRDLVWTAQPSFRTVGDDGREYVAGLVPVDEFYRRYEELSGLKVIPETLRFYRVLNAFLVLCSAMGTSYRVARLGKSHQDIVLSRVEGVVPVMLKELRTLLEEA